MFCTKCGTEIKEGQKFCTKCGAKIEQIPQQVSRPAEQPQETARRLAPPVEKPVEPAGKPAKKTSDGKKTNQVLLIIVVILAVLVVLLIAAVLIKTQIIDKDGSGSRNDGWEESDREDRDSENDEDEKNEVEESEETAVKDDENQVEAASAVELLQQKSREVCNELSDARGKAYDVRWNTYDDYGSIGVIGCLIQDISGDGVEDMVVVYANTDFATVSADVYTVENGAIVQKADGLFLWEGMHSDNASGAVYLKNTPTGYNLIADVAAGYNHFADGADGWITAYACQDHAYTRVVEYSYAGSDLYEEERYILEQGRNAGLHISGVDLGNMYVIGDTDVRVIAGYGLRVDENIDWMSWYETAYDGKLYGTLKILRLTDADNFANQQAANDFFRQYGQNWDNWAGESAEDGDYILPESSSRKMTALDLEAIENDKDLLRLARNELYARHGRKFTDEELQAYFLSKDWYVPVIDADDFNEDMLTEVEKYNRDLIKQYEEALD